MKKLTNRTLWRRSAAMLLSASLLLSSPMALWAADANTDRMNEVKLLLEQAHVSAPAANVLAGKSIEEMIQALDDPYTQYFTPEELKGFENSVENNYVGIGVRISEDPAGIYIEDLFEDSPALKAGMKSGDIIVRVEDQSLVGKTTEEAMRLILGPENTKVNVTVLRNGQELKLQLTRKQIHIPPVSSGWFAPGVGYLSVSTFSSDADELMEKHLKELKSKGSGLTGLIVDLRNNGGGLLDTAVQMAKLFVEKGVLIHTRDRDNIDEKVEFSNGQKQPFPVFFLVNEYSASASEVLTGALQDYHAATVIGKKTYGKGSVQTVFDLQSGGALKVTVEEYLTPNLRKVNKVGLQPDQEVEGSVPQMITALRMAGVPRLEVSKTRENVYMNGVKVNDWFPVLREQGGIYVPSRVLAAVLGGKVSWDQERSAVEITTADGSLRYSPSGEDWILREGTSFIDVRRFAEAFPSFQWSEEGSTVKFSTSKE
ncbi:S41 family peptidase [Paenibacillus sp. GD4]|uniref:S41 family peptidase n=1 Tax=Paenibacillus sp. GD4 TaxID=3068890 RepID=UPI0027965633|nr:S41 family peptidase [Paenibacillus sp. GD4]MDQ1909284.1 S41 family peptidase [Paenibacillus sp. GD4]